MRKFLLILPLLLLCSPLAAQEGLQDVYARENERLNLLVRWSPGQPPPELPPIVRFSPSKVFDSSVSTAKPEQPTDSEPNYDFTSWISEYNKGITLTEAALISRTIIRYARLHDVDPKLVVALVATESAFRRDARSPAGAQGLGQLMPATAAMLGVTDPWEPEQNLSGTVRYLARQLQRWNDSAELALASYNAGPGAVERYGGIPPYRETQEYVSYVLSLHRELQSLERRRSVVSQTRAKHNS